MNFVNCDRSPFSGADELVGRRDVGNPPDAVGGRDQRYPVPHHRRPDQQKIYIYKKCNFPTMTRSAVGCMGGRFVGHKC